jgi:signal transduction histidine kinase
LLLLGALYGALAVPLYRLSKRIADHVVFGGRTAPSEVVSGFATRLSGTYATEDVLPRIAAVLGEATRARETRVWARVGREFLDRARWPAGVEALSPVVGYEDAVPPLPEADHVSEIRDRGELLGAIAVSLPANDPLDAARERLVRDLASQAGLVLRNVRLIDDLRSSRLRLVAAQDEERRRIERNIHDGAQQDLVALAVKARLAGTVAAQDPERASALLEEIQAELTEALENLRDLARGVYPPLLADRGLEAALTAQARKSSTPVTIEADGTGRYPRELEATVYFCVLEALQNVGKYARARSVTVRLAANDGELGFEVADDGVGFDPATQNYGTGLQGIADRLSAYGGEVEVESTPGEGSTIRGRLPIRSPA